MGKHKKKQAQVVAAMEMPQYNGFGVCVQADNYEEAEALAFRFVNAKQEAEQRRREEENKRCANEALQRAEEKYARAQEAMAEAYEELQEAREAVGEFD